MTPVVELIAARKRYGAVEALRGVDLCIRPGGDLSRCSGPETVPGKRPAVRLMLGLRRPDVWSARASSA